jgi:mono/diheme cytochrome c family protein
MDELLNKVAEMRGMPASLVKRSAEARAEKEGMTLEAVLADWAGEEAGAASATDEAPAVEAAPEPPAVDGPASEPDSVSEVPGEITVDYLIKLASEAKRMPAKLILTSAEARAKHSGASLEIVLAGWAGVDLDELKEQAANAPAASTSSDAAPAVEETPAADPEPPAEVASPEPAVVAAAVAGAAISMDELLEKVAEAKGMPAALAKRSAEARAKKTGEPLESVLAEWAGVDPASVTTDEAPAAPAPPPPSEPAADVTEKPAAAEEEIEVIEALVEEPDAPEVSARSSRYPAWLAAAFVLIPLLAVTYILVSPNGPDCGTSAQLLVDPVTGNAVNCDGSEYGTSVVDYFANGAGLYASAQCQACHAADGSGGAGPAFSGGELLTTFPAGSCSEQIDWVSLGTAGWPDATYGANNKPVGGFGLMPAYGATLDEQQIAEVVLYERVQFGGEDLAAAQEDCGLGDDHGAEDDSDSVEAAGS